MRLLCLCAKSALSLVMLISVSARAAAALDKPNESRSELSRVAASVAPQRLSSSGLHPDTHSLQHLHDLHAISFLENRGQAAPGVLWMAEGPNYQATFQKNSFILKTARTNVSAPDRAKEHLTAASLKAEGHDLLDQPRNLQKEQFKEQAIEFAGANPLASIEPLDKRPGTVSFFRGADPSHWVAGESTYARLRYKNIYPGIDLIFYGHDGQLEYDFVVAAGADPSLIRMKINGNEIARTTADGALRLGDLVHRPLLYQNIENGKRMVAGSFIALSPDTFGFRFGSYDKTKTFIIDPTINLVYSTYAGGIHNDQAFGMAIDPQGNTYITGWSRSDDFPVSSNGYSPVAERPEYTGLYDGIVMKFNPSGTLLYSTYLGGTNNNAAGQAIVVDSTGSAYIGGYSQATDFPVTSGAYQKIQGGGSDAFLSKLSSDGSQLLYSTYLGGTGDEAITSLLMNADGSLWTSGVASQAGLPVSANAFQRMPNGVDNSFIAKLQFDTSSTLQIPYLTYIGGSQSGQTNGPGEGWPSNLTLDAAGNVYYAGTTQSSDYPVTANAYEQPVPLSHGCTASGLPNTIGVVTKFSPDLSQMLYSTYFGGRTEATAGYAYCNQGISSIQIDKAGDIWLYGYTAETDVPTTANALSRQLNGTGNASGQDAFLGELSPDGTSLLYGTYIGGSQLDGATSMVFDPSGNIWLSGSTGSTDFPTTPDALQSANISAGYNFTVTEFSPTTFSILYSTYFGGTADSGFSSALMALDSFGNIHLTGSTNSTSFPVTANAFQPLYSHGDPTADSADIFYSVLGSGAIGSISTTSGGNSGDTTITLNGSGFQNGATCQLAMGSSTVTAGTVSVSADGTTMSCTFSLNGSTPGSYDVVVSNPNGGATFKQPAAFTVQPGGGPNLSVQIVGYTVIRTGVPSTYYVSVTNSGNANAYMVPVWITLPVNLPFSIGTLGSTLSSQLPSSDGTNNYVSVMIPQVAPGQTVEFPVQITSPADNPKIAIAARVQAPWFATLNNMNNYLAAQASVPSCVPDPVNSYASNCFGQYLNDLGTSSTPLAVKSKTNATPFDSPAQTAKQWNDDIKEGVKDGESDAAAGLNKYPPKDLKPENLAYDFGYGMGIMAGALNNISKQIPNISPGPGPGVGTGSGSTPAPGGSTTATPPTTGTGTITTTSQGSSDPNEKTGPTGDGSASHFVTASAPLNYFIGFENQASAALPAATVVVTDQLDPTKVDLTTLKLGSIAIGGNLITLPSGTNSYATTFTPPGVTTYVVRIQGSLDAQTGLLKWTFQTIDPSTGLPPSDPTIGFLPPDADGVIGQAGLVFNIVPKSGSATGTQITNAATVVFDRNAPIVTATWLNTLDISAPVSKVTALPATSPVTGGAGTFTVNWSGTDSGSGIVRYDIYVSDNGGAFTLWQSSITTTSATYTGTLGHTYGFYSIATDGAGNTEASKTAAEATTQVALTATTTTLAASAASVNIGTAVTFTATVAPTSGSGTPTTTVTFFDGTTALGQGTVSTAGIATYATTALAAGTHSITAVYAGDSNFATSTSTAVTVTVVAPTPDFSITLTPATGQTTAGSSVSTALSVTPVNGFNQAISFACSGLPAGATCGFSPATVTPNGAPAQTTLTIQTKQQQALLALPSNHPATIRVALLGAALFCFGSFFRKRRWSSSLASVCLLAILTLTIGCAGGSSSNTTTTTVTPTTSTITITATAGTTTHTATYTLTVQ